VKQSTQPKQRPFIFWGSFCIGTITCYLYLYDIETILSRYIRHYVQAKHFVIQKDGTLHPATSLPLHDPSIPVHFEESVSDLFNTLNEKKGYLTLFPPDDNTYEILLKLIEKEQ
jgi:hypothetical protein